MSAVGGSSRSSSVKARALQYLQKVKEVSKEIFRNLQTVSKTGRDEPGGSEKADTLRGQRENYIQLLCSVQSELHESVGELDKFMDCKKKMVGMKEKIEQHEVALRNFGTGLKSAEQILSDALETTFHEGRSSSSDLPVELDVDDLIRYSHVISYTTSAQEGWEPNTTLTGALPPAPQSEMMARSRLFSMHPSRPPNAEVPATRRDEQGAAGTGAGIFGAGGEATCQDGGLMGPGELGKRVRQTDQSDDDEMLKIWSHPLLPADDGQSDAAAARSDEMQPPQKRQAAVLPLAACLRENHAKDKHAQDKGGVDGRARDSTVDPVPSENAAANVRHEAYIEMPKMPLWWRPGMPIVVAPDKHSC